MEKRESSLGIPHNLYRYFIKTLRFKYNDRKEWWCPDEEKQDMPYM